MGESVHLKRSPLVTSNVEKAMFSSRLDAAISAHGCRQECHFPKKCLCWDLVSLVLRHCMFGGFDPEILNQQLNFYSLKLKFEIPF